MGSLDELSPITLPEDTPEVEASIPTVETPAGGLNLDALGPIIEETADAHQEAGAAIAAAQTEVGLDNLRGEFPEGNSDEEEIDSGEQTRTDIELVETPTEGVSMIERATGWLQFDTLEEDLQDVNDDLNDFSDIIGDFASASLSRLDSHIQYLQASDENRAVALGEIQASKETILEQSDDATEFVVTYLGERLIFNDKGRALQRIRQLEQVFEETEFNMYRYIEASLGDVLGVGKDGIFTIARTVGNGVEILWEGVVMGEKMVWNWETGDDSWDIIKNGLFVLLQIAAVWYAGSKVNSYITNVASEARTGVNETVRNEFADNLREMSELKEQAGIKNSSESSVLQRIENFSPQTPEGNPDQTAIASRIYRSIKESFGGHALLPWLGERLTNRYSEAHRYNVAHESDPNRSRVRYRPIGLLTSVINRNNTRNNFFTRGFTGWRFQSQSDIVRQASVNMGRNVERLRRGLELIDLAENLSQGDRDKLRKRYARLFDNSTVDVENSSLMRRINPLVADGTPSSFLRRNLNLNMTRIELGRYLVGNAELTPEVKTSIDAVETRYINFVDNHPSIDDTLEKELRSQIQSHSVLAKNKGEAERFFQNILQSNGLSYTKEQVVTIEANFRGNSINTIDVRSSVLLDVNTILDTMGLDDAEKTRRLRVAESFLNGDKTFYSRHFVAIIEIIVEGGDYDSSTKGMSFDDIKANPPYELYVEQKTNNPGRQFHTGGVIMDIPSGMQSIIPADTGTVDPADTGTTEDTRRFGALRDRIPSISTVGGFLRDFRDGEGHRGEPREIDTTTLTPVIAPAELDSEAPTLRVEAPEDTAAGVLGAPGDELVFDMEGLEEGTPVDDEVRASAVAPELERVADFPDMNESPIDSDGELTPRAESILKGNIIAFAINNGNLSVDLDAGINDAITEAKSVDTLQEFAQSLQDGLQNGDLITDANDLDRLSMDSIRLQAQDMLERAFVEDRGMRFEPLRVTINEGKINYTLDGSVIEIDSIEAIPDHLEARYEITTIPEWNNLSFTHDTIQTNRSTGIPNFLRSLDDFFRKAR